MLFYTLIFSVAVCLISLVVLLRAMAKDYPLKSQAHRSYFFFFSMMIFWLLLVSYIASGNLYVNPTLGKQPPKDERPIKVERKLLTYLRFNPSTDLYEFGNESSNLTAPRGQVTFITLSDEGTDPYTMILSSEHLGNFGLHYVLHINCTLNSPVFPCQWKKRI